MRLQVLLSVCAALLVSGCFYHVERAMVAVNKDDRIDVDIKVDIGPKELTTGSPNQSSVAPSIEEVARLEREQRVASEARENSEKCFGGVSSESIQNGRSKVQFSIRSQTIFQLEQSFDCIVVGSDRRKLKFDMKTIEDFVSRTQIVDFWYDGELTQPTEFIFKFESPVNAQVQIKPQSMTTVVRQIDQNSVSVVIKPINCTAADCDGPLSLQFTSRNMKFGLNELLAIVGLLFGSGVIISIASLISVAKAKRLKIEAQPK